MEIQGEPESKFVDCPSPFFRFKFVLCQYLLKNKVTQLEIRRLKSEIRQAFNRLQESSMRNFRSTYVNNTVEIHPSTRKEVTKIGDRLIDLINSVARTKEKPIAKQLSRTKKSRAFQKDQSQSESEQRDIKRKRAKNNKTQSQYTKGKEKSAILNQRSKQKQKKDPLSKSKAKFIQKAESKQRLVQKPRSKLRSKSKSQQSSGSDSPVSKPKTRSQIKTTKPKKHISQSSNSISISSRALRSRTKQSSKNVSQRSQHRR